MNDAVIQAFLNAIESSRPKIREMYLFGSRARGDEQPDSDYDVLIVTKEKDLPLKDSIYDAVTDVCLKYRRDISLKVFPAEKFDRLKNIPSRFIQNVMAEGIKIG